MTQRPKRLPLLALGYAADVWRHIGGKRKVHPRGALEWAYALLNLSLASSSGNFNLPKVASPALGTGYYISTICNWPLG